MASTRDRGGHWEGVAESILNKRGLVTLERNYTARGGEIDLVMRDGPVLVFAEVRFRSNRGFGSGADSVTMIKQKRLILAAQWYLHCHPSEQNRACRFDVISIGSEDGRTLFNWIRNAFESS